MRQKQVRHFLVWAVTTAALMLEAAACGAEKSEYAQAAKPANAELPAIGEKADRLLRDMSDYLKAAKEFSFHAEITYDDLLPSGQKLLFAAEHDVAVRRPDRLYSNYQGETGRKRLWYDGKTVALLDEIHNTYATETAPSTIDAMLDYLITELGFTPPLSDLLYEDPYAVLRRNTIFGFDVGPSSVDGVRCHHLAFVEDNIDWQIWIDEGKLRVPRKLAITYKTLPGAPQFIAVLSDWELSDRLPDSLFAPELPTGAVKIEFLKAAKSVQGKNAPAVEKR